MGLLQTLHISRKSLLTRAVLAISKDQPDVSRILFSIKLQDSAKLSTIQQHGGYIFKVRSSEETDHIFRSASERSKDKFHHLGEILLKQWPQSDFQKFDKHSQELKTARSIISSLQSDCILLAPFQPQPVPPDQEQHPEAHSTRITPEPCPIFQEDSSPLPQSSGITRSSAHPNPSIQSNLKKRKSRNTRSYEKKKKFQNGDQHLAEHHQASSPNRSLESSTPPPSSQIGFEPTAPMPASTLLAKSASPPIPQISKISLPWEYFGCPFMESYKK